MRLISAAATTAVLLYKTTEAIECPPTTSADYYHQSQLGFGAATTPATIAGTTAATSEAAAMAAAAAKADGKHGHSGGHHLQHHNSHRKTCPDFKASAEQEFCCPSKVTFGAYYCCTSSDLAILEAEETARRRAEFLHQHAGLLVLGSVALAGLLLFLISVLCRHVRGCPMYRPAGSSASSAARRQSGGGGGGGGGQDEGRLLGSTAARRTTGGHLLPHHHHHQQQHHYQNPYHHHHHHHHHPQTGGYRPVVIDAQTPSGNLPAKIYEAPPPYEQSESSGTTDPTRWTCFLENELNADRQATAEQRQRLLDHQQRRLPETAIRAPNENDDDDDDDALPH